MQSTFICTINLHKSSMFQSSNDTGCLVGLRHPINSKFKTVEDLTYFRKFVRVLTQNRVFEISSMSQIFDSVMLATWIDLKKGYLHMDHGICC